MKPIIRSLKLKRTITQVFILETHSLKLKEPVTHSSVLKEPITRSSVLKEPITRSSVLKTHSLKLKQTIIQSSVSNQPITRNLVPKEPITHSFIQQECWGYSISMFAEAQLSPILMISSQTLLPLNQLLLLVKTF